MAMLLRGLSSLFFVTMESIRGYKYIFNKDTHCIFFCSKRISSLFVFIGRIVSNRIVRPPIFLTLWRKEKDYEFFTIHEKADCRSCNFGH